MSVHASCHCGAVQWDAPQPDELHTCNCSFCDRSGAVWTSTPENEFHLTTMPQTVSGYQFGTYMTKHYHCARCGMALYTWSPKFSQDGTPDIDNPIITWNVRMAPDLDRSKLKITKMDGQRY